MARIKKVAISPSTMAYYESLQDGGFQQAAIASTPSVSTPTTSAPTVGTTPFDDIRDVGFEARAEQSGKPFIPFTPQSTLQGSGNETIDPDKDPDKDPNVDPNKDLNKKDGNEPELDYDQRNAIDIVKGYLKQWNLESLESIVLGWISKKVSADAALMNLRREKAYKDRFSGLELREKAGLTPIDEATYLALEDDYDAWARYYGVEGAFGTTAAERQKNFGNLIGKNVSATLFRDFADTIVTRVDRADPAIKQTLNRFYGITDTDLKNYYINPSENIKALQEKVTAAEIGAAGIAQALNVSRTRAEDLARFGIDRQTAITGYQRIAGALPQGQLLSGIYGEEGINYTQETAEEEEFKEMESAARARRRLAGLSEASFRQSGALTQGSLGNRGVAGQI
jgi:hypothetical protein